MSRRAFDEEHETLAKTPSSTSPRRPAAPRRPGPVGAAAHVNVAPLRASASPGTPLSSHLPKRGPFLIRPLPRA